MNKLLAICGPTATGKTKLAFELAKKFDGELLSADSRQVYKELDIGTGKDWGDGSIRVWGYDIADPREDFNVSQFVEYANKKIDEILGRGKLPILVGGTGLYIKGVTEFIETMHIPPDKILRQRLKDKSAYELFKILSEISSKKADSLNESDRKNPRRLIRAIEVESAKIALNIHSNRESKQGDTLFVGLTVPNELLKKRIVHRVKERIKMGIENEIKKLLSNGVTFNHQSMTSLGYRQWKEYLEGKKTKDEVIAEWIREEIKYAKRQMTWFKKNSRINWFDISNKEYEKEVEKLVKKWYSNSNAVKN